MPTYEFTCPEGHDFEKFYRSIGVAPPTVQCPVCGKTAERRLSGAGLVFKGSGFYITDYGKDGKKDQKPTVKSDASAGSESKPAESKPADAKPAESKPTESKPAESKPAPSSAPSSDSSSTSKE